MKDNLHRFLGSSAEDEKSINTELLIVGVIGVITGLLSIFILYKANFKPYRFEYFLHRTLIKSATTSKVLGCLGRCFLFVPIICCLAGMIMALVAEHIEVHIAVGIMCLPTMIYCLILAMGQWYHTLWNTSKYNALLILIFALGLILYLAITLYYAKPFSFTSAASIYFAMNFFAISGAIFNNYYDIYIKLKMLLSQFKASIKKAPGNHELGQDNFHKLLDETMKSNTDKQKGDRNTQFLASVIILIIFTVSEGVMEDDGYKGVGGMNSFFIIILDIIIMLWSKTKIGSDFSTPRIICFIFFCFRITLSIFLRYWIFGHGIAYIIVSCFLLHSFTEIFASTNTKLFGRYTRSHKIFSLLYYFIITIIYLVDIGVASMSLEQLKLEDCKGIEQYKFALGAIFLPLIYMAGGVVFLLHRNKYNFRGWKLYAFAGLSVILFCALAAYSYYIFKEESDDTGGLLALLFVFTPFILITGYIVVNRWRINDAQFYVPAAEVNIITRKIEILEEPDSNPEQADPPIVVSNGLTLFMYVLFILESLLLGILCYYILRDQGWIGFSISLWILIFFCIFISFYGYTRTFYQMNLSIIIHGLFSVLLLILWGLAMIYSWSSMSSWALLIIGIACAFMSFSILFLALYAFDDKKYILSANIIALLIISVLFSIGFVILIGIQFKIYEVSIVILFIILLALIFIQWRRNQNRLTRPWSILLAIMFGLCLVWGIVSLIIDPGAQTFLIVWSFLMCFISIFFLSKAYMKWSMIISRKFKSMNCSEYLFPIFKYDSRNRGMKISNQTITYFLSFLGCLLIWALGASLPVDEKDRFIPLFLAGAILSSMILTFRHLVFASVNVRHRLVRQIFTFNRLFKVYSLAFGPLFCKKSTVISIREEPDIKNEMADMELREKELSRKEERRTFSESMCSCQTEFEDVERQILEEEENMSKDLPPNATDELYTWSYNEHRERIWNKRDHAIDKSIAAFGYHLNNQIYLYKMKKENEEKIKAGVTSPIPVYIPGKTQEIYVIEDTEEIKKEDTERSSFKTSVVPDYKSIESEQPVKPVNKDSISAKPESIPTKPETHKIGFLPRQPTIETDSVNDEPESLTEDADIYNNVANKERDQGPKTLEIPNKGDITLEDVVRIEEVEIIQRVEEEKESEKDTEKDTWKDTEKDELKIVGEVPKRGPTLLPVEEDPSTQLMPSVMRISTPLDSGKTLGPAPSRHKPKKYNDDDIRTWNGNYDFASDQIYEDMHFRRKPLTKSNAIWCRAIDLNPKDFHVEVFQDGVSHEDITQGSLGDCWLISAMIVIAVVRPKYIQKIFHPDCRTTRINGHYYLRFFKNGQRKEIELDDYFPALSYGQNPIMCRMPIHIDNKIKEIWPMLVEKGMAKLYGGYDELNGGTVDTAFMDLTGGASVKFDMADDTTQRMIADNSLWFMLEKFASKGYLMGCGSPEGEDTEVSNLGIVQGHAYAILAVIECDRQQLIQLKNPWGKTEWKGDWSDNCYRWNKKLKMNVEEIKYRTKLEIWRKDKAEEETPPQREKDENKDDGVFYMCMADFVTNFSMFYACRFFDPAEWLFLGIKPDQWTYGRDGGCTNYPRTVKNNPHYKLDVNKRDKLTVFIMVQSYKTGGMSEPHLPIGFEIYAFRGKRIGDPNLYLPIAENMGGYQEERQISLEIALAPGSYMILVSTFMDGRHGEFGLSVWARTADRSHIAFEKFY